MHFQRPLISNATLSSKELDTLRRELKTDVQTPMEDITATVMNDLFPDEEGANPSMSLATRAAVLDELKRKVRGKHKQYCCMTSHFFSAFGGLRDGSAVGVACPPSQVT